MILHRFGTLDSTQRVARERAEAGAPHGSVILAEHQTAGRGRLGRSWLDEPGQNLTFSVVVRPRGSARTAPLLCLGAAAGLATAFDLRVKWPNDVVTQEGRKVAGLLAEMETTGLDVRWVVLGVGLNVNQTVFAPELPNAASLAQLGGPRDRDETLETAVAAILAWCEHEGRLDLWRSRAHTLGRRVRIGDVEGVATHLRDDGALVVGGVVVSAGEIG